VPRHPRSRPLPTARFAAIIVLLVVAAAVAFLIACPPAARGTGTQATPARQPTAPRSPEAQSQPNAGSSVRSSQPGSIPPEHPRQERQGLLAVIIDDAGYSLEELQAFLDLPLPLTVAVLPHLPHSQEAARRVLAAGKDLILHCPMEPNGGEDPGPGALYTGQSPQQIEALLDAAFASVPGAIGMNNHMGSKATAEESLMTTVLGYLKRKGMLYIDSRTTPDTVGPRIARQLGVPVLERNVFIDVGTGDEQIASAFDKGVAEARARGSTVLIGHVQNKGVVDILRAMNARLAGQGVRLARLVDVLADREGNPSP